MTGCHKLSLHFLNLESWLRPKYIDIVVCARPEYVFKLPTYVFLDAFSEDILRMEIVFDITVVAFGLLHVWTELTSHPYSSQDCFRILRISEF